MDGKVAVVTGAATGLGRAYARALAHAGAAVVVNDVGAALDGTRIPDAGPGAVVQEIRAHGGRALGILESVADAAAVQRLIQEAVAAFGRLDILVNNAGIVRSRPVIEMSDADFDAVLEVHLRGTFLCTREAMRAMRTGSRGGRIINITSGAAFAAPYPGTANYAAAKGGIISFTRVVAAEAQEFGITCNAVAPLARTRMSERHLGNDTDATLEPEMVAPLIVFLASDAAAAINGEVFRVARNEISVVRSTVDAPMRPNGERWTAEEIAQRVAEICATSSPSHDRQE
ncbi:MAG: SDR family NAD(P)-dependent oxidoreductase [Candidatus Binatia bacterium]